MGLKETRQRFFAIRKSCEIVVKKHAFQDYPKRGFSEREIIELVRKGVGAFEENRSAIAIPDSFLFKPKDERKRECKLVILLQVLEVEGEEESDELIIVCSAYRDI